MNSLERRLKKLEGSVASETDLRAAVRDLTGDQLQVRLLIVWHRIVKDYSSKIPDVEIEKAKAEIQKIENEIVRCKLKRAKPEYQRHIKWVESGWRQHPGARGEYVPALLKDEYDGIHKPDIMDRRRAVRAEPLVAMVLAKMKQ